MWEYRVSWTSSAPVWWSHAWQRGVDRLAAAAMQPETRDDDYWMLDGRDDVGLKLRGARQDEFDVKVMYDRADGWELWEKVTFRAWSALEAVRFGVLLQTDPSFHASTKNAAEGAKAVLQAAGIDTRPQRVTKKRLQTTAGELFRGTPGLGTDDRWIAELAELEIPGRRGTIWSVCFETARRRSAPAGFFTPGALRCGYPELLHRSTGPQKP